MPSREGFKEEEIPEYLERKTEAIVMIAGGLILGFGVPILIGVTGGYAYSGLQIIGVGLFFCGVIVAAYGWHYWGKVTHIMWTRQALREYGVKPTERHDIPSSSTVSGNNVATSTEDPRHMLELADKALVEGKITEETYKYLRTKYQSSSPSSTPTEPRPIMASDSLPQIDNVPKGANDMSSRFNRPLNHFSGAIRQYL